jgi:hypothetical protein
MPRSCNPAIAWPGPPLARFIGVLAGFGLEFVLEGHSAPQRPITDIAKSPDLELEFLSDTPSRNIYGASPAYS